MCTCTRMNTCTDWYMDMHVDLCIDMRLGMCALCSHTLPFVPLGAGTICGLFAWAW